MNKTALIKIIFFYFFLPYGFIVVLLSLSIIGINLDKIPSVLFGSPFDQLFKLAVLVMLFGLYLPKNWNKLNTRAISWKVALLLVPLSIIIRLPLLLIFLLPFSSNGQQGIEVGIQANGSYSGLGILNPTLDYITLVLATDIVTPILEEMFFRGIIFNFLKSKYSLLVSLILSSLLFSLLHGNVILITITFIHGLIFGYVYYRFKNIFYPIFLHSLINFSSSIPFLIWH